MAKIFSENSSVRLYEFVARVTTLLLMTGVYWTFCCLRSELLKVDHPLGGAARIFTRSSVVPSFCLSLTQTSRLVRALRSLAKQL